MGTKELRRIEEGKKEKECVCVLAKQQTGFKKANRAHMEKP